MLRQYYWRYVYSANRQSAANMKNLRKAYYYRLCEFATLCPLAQRRRRHASLLSAGIDVVPITDSIQRQYNWRYVARSALLIFPELAYKFGSTDLKRKKGKTKMKSK